MKISRALSPGFVLLWLVLAIVCNSLVPGRVQAAPLRQQSWLVPSGVSGVPMHTTMLWPQGRGPFPLVVINHGSTAIAEQRALMTTTDFAPVAAWFVQHGYVVALPLRPGHGSTGGPSLEGIGSCEHPDYGRAGLGAAASMAAAVGFLIRQPAIRNSGVVLLGHSAGGWGALATASQNPPGVGAVINFAGGLGGHSFNEPNQNCAPDRLVQTAAAFGRTARVPTLWLYAQNDTYFNAALSQQMANAFRAAGGAAEYHLLPPFGADGHFLMFSRDALPLWAPIVARFLHLGAQ